MDHGLESLKEQYSRSRGPSFVCPNSRRVFGHSNTRSTTPSPPRICACEGASKQVDQRGRHAVPELQLSRHNAMPPTCVSQSSQTDERRRARRGERTETHAWADVGAFRHTRRQRTHTCRAALFSVVAIPVTVIGGGDNCHMVCMHTAVEASGGLQTRRGGRRLHGYAKLQSRPQSRAISEPRWFG